MKGRNFITPIIIDFCNGNNVEIELSEGIGVFNNDYRLYGVTIAFNGEIDYDTSKLYRSIETASKYYKELKEKYI